MPNTQDKVALMRWVEDLPVREQTNGYEHMLRLCAERYNNTSGDLSTTMDLIVEQFMKTMRENMNRYMESNNSFPTPGELEEIMTTVYRGALLRMWVYASEYYQRWTAPDIIKPLDDEAFQGFLQSLGGEG